MLLRPIRPEDEVRLKQLIDQSRPEDIYFRFFGAVRELPNSQLARFTQIDYDGEMATDARARREPSLSAWPPSGRRGGAGFTQTLNAPRPEHLSDPIT
jgi:hypothetical protein